MLGLRLRVGLMTSVLRLLLFLLLFLGETIRWLFAPLMLLLQGLFMVPYAKTTRYPVARSSFQRVSESELPDDAWIYFKETASLLGLLGFRPGSFVRLSGIIGNQTTYGMPLIHTRLRTGMGVNYSVISDVSGKTIADRRFVELTAECGQGKMVDFTNNEELEPFIPASRTRVRLPFVSELELLYLFSAFTARRNCTLSDTTLARLENEPDAVMWDEFRSGMEELARHGYLALLPEDKEMRMTWKGALTAGLFAQWPLSVLVGWKRKRATDRLFEKYGISRDEAAMVHIASFLDPLPWTSQSFATLESLRSNIDPLVKRFSEEMLPVSVEFFYSGTAATNTLTNIHATYALHAECAARKLTRSTELLLDIDSSNGHINWLTVDDGHYAPGEYDANEDDLQPLTAPGGVLLSLQRVQELTEPLVSQQAGGREIRNESMLISADGDKTFWHRSACCIDGDLIEIDLDGVSGEVLRSECVS